MDGETPGPSPRGEAGAAAPLAAAVGARTLIAIIIAMPVVFLIAAVGVVLIFGPPGGKKTAPPAPPPAHEAAPAETAAPIVLPDGARAGAMALDGDRLALRIEGPEGETIVVYDLSAGRVIATIPVLTEPAPKEDRP